MVLVAALKIGRDLLWLHFEEIDKNLPLFADRQVKIRPSGRAFMKECGDGGWIAIGFPTERGDRQFPQIILVVSWFIFSAVNYYDNVCSSLTSGASCLISSFGNDYFKQKSVARMLYSEWQSIIALTEQQAGSSLAYITTEEESSKKVILKKNMALKLFFEEVQKTIFGGGQFLNLPPMRDIKLFPGRKSRRSLLP